MRGILSVIQFLLFLGLVHHSQGQANITGYTCSANHSIYPCHTYVFYRARSPDFLDLATVGDLFGVSRLMVAEASNISSPASPLVPDQSLFVPITCSCDSKYNLSYANITYTIEKDDTYYLVSTNLFQNLTTYQSVIVVNPTLIPEDLQIGVQVNFPIFCGCPNSTQLQNKINYLITYVIQPSDTFASIAQKFGLKEQSLRDINGGTIYPNLTIFLPVSRLPELSQPSIAPSASISPSTTRDRKGLITGLAIGLGVAGFLLILLLLVMGFWVYREVLLKRGYEIAEDKEKSKFKKGGMLEGDFMADVSDCLDKYIVYGVEEVRKATDGFNPSCLIQGSVYKGSIDGEVYVIKKMKWNAWDELKILQKVNHGNLVKLEGFCMDPEYGNCYFVYEYVENGSLHSWLHGENNKRELDWKTRLRIVIDVANGLQYIHEHTRPKVVHKDIKTSNILLDGNMRAKIANFGLAKSGYNAITTHIVGTQGYISPEYLADGIVTTKIDVFAFGVVLLELISGKEAINEEGKLLWMELNAVMEGNEDEKERKLKAWMDSCLVEESGSKESVMNVMAVAQACLQTNPSKRPNMVDIVYMLCKSDALSLDFSVDSLSFATLTAR
ncbi:PREDICTED: serine/threonine receptor-like kinase NFP [Nelumbo nucifera]|uniref:Serine/threonine receptor-like kinase NFP n=1 Tax=Nelumbo nucifera TaxID=4432 RepID=A0A1U8BCA1_NELNU|nr:PREDICTED: serine/threonine receptor-like kinase NFP [Nelumbo nucifera]